MKFVALLVGVLSAASLQRESRGPSGIDKCHFYIQIFIVFKVVH